MTPGFERAEANVTKVGEEVTALFVCVMSLLR